MRSPIQRITGTAMELPIARYLGASGHSDAAFPRHGMRVHPSGNPWSLSHSSGVSLRTTPLFVATASLSVLPSMWLCSSCTPRPLLEVFAVRIPYVRTLGTCPLDPGVCDITVGETSSS